VISKLLITLWSTGAGPVFSSMAYKLLQKGAESIPIPYESESTDAQRSFTSAFERKKYCNYSARDLNIKKWPLGYILAPTQARSIQ